MVTLGILGSPRRGGNSEILLDEALAGAKSRGSGTRKIVLNTLTFSPCQECAGVRKDGVCRVRDEMDAVYAAVEEADVVVVASPIFFGSVSAQTKMMIDRFQCMWLAKYVLRTVPVEKNKRGIFLSVSGATRDDFFDNGKAVVKNFFATIGAVYAGEVLCPGVDGKAAIREKPECLALARAVVAGAPPDKGVAAKGAGHG